MSRSWRDVARPIIAKVLRDTAGRSEKEVRSALFDAYPFGERAMHPYKVWCDEIRRQRGICRSTAKHTKQRQDDGTADLFAATEVKR